SCGVCHLFVSHRKRDPREFLASKEEGGGVAGGPARPPIIIYHVMRPVVGDKKEWGGGLVLGFVEAAYKRPVNIHVPMVFHGDADLAGRGEEREGYISPYSALSVGYRDAKDRRSRGYAMDEEEKEQLVERPPPEPVQLT